MEAEILLWIQNCVRADWLTPLVKCITYLGNAGFIWILLSLMLLLIPRAAAPWLYVRLGARV